ncbi:MAG TPA: DoxX family protein [Flavobacterium sp.]|nr:DoxX family protein [Flavobacterium sp.]
MTSQQNTSKTHNIALWVAQVLVALTFLMGGAMKLGQPIEALSAQLPWTGDVNPILVRILGGIDVLGGLGLLLPHFLKKPQLTAWAAYGGLLLMVSAIVFHLLRGESNVIGFNIFLIVLLGLIAWGRRNS